MMYFVESGVRTKIWKIRGLFLRLYLALHGCRAGKRITCMGWPFFKQIPKGNIILGNSITIGRNVTLEVGKKGTLIIGNHVNISDGVYFGVQRSVKVGDYSGFGERVSIRDSTHMFRRKTPHLLQSSFAKDIEIGVDVSVGLGSAILSGAKIEDGVVLGAGTVITSQNETKPYTFYRGDPPTEIGVRP